MEECTMKTSERKFYSTVKHAKIIRKKFRLLSQIGQQLI